MTSTLLTNPAITLCHLDDLPDGDSRGFDPNGSGRDTVLVVRQAVNVYAYQNACPHVDGSPLAWQKNRYLNAARDRIVCSGHGAEFDIVTGICTLGPCQGERLTALDVFHADSGEVRLAQRQLQEIRA